MTDPKETPSTVNKPGGLLNRRTTLIAGAAAVIAAGAGWYLSKDKNAGTTASNSNSSNGAMDKLMVAGPLKENSLGNENAPVTIIEYSSMTCPHCASFHATTLPDLKKKYIDTGKVRYIIREFPLDPLAMAAFMLARCAGKEKYFPFVDALYETQRTWAFTQGDPVPELKKMASQVGFTEESFNKCLTDIKLRDDINWVRKRGSEEFGVNSTPTFFINGTKLAGSHNLEKFEEMMAPFLKG